MKRTQLRSRKKINSFGMGESGIEEKLRALAMKELAAAGMKKEAKELELLGYRTAVVGASDEDFM